MVGAAVTATSAGPLRIVVISNALPPHVRGGAERHAADLAGWLASRHSVDVLAGYGPETVGDAPVHRLPARPLLHPGTSRPAKALWHLREQWLPSVHRAVRDRLRELRANVVHTHECQGLSAAVFTGIAAAGVPHVHTAHDYNLICTRVTLTKDGEFCGARCATCAPQRLIRSRAIGRRLQHLIAPSEYVRDAHIRAGVVPPERATTIRNGVRAPLHEGRHDSRADRPFTLGYLGALSEHKGVATLLRAFERAPEGWRLIVAGEGELADEVAQRASEDPRVEFRGYVEGAAKDELFSAIDLLVVPSEWEDPSPTVAIEAAVRAVPCLVSDRGGLPETLAAFTFAARSDTALLARLHELAESPQHLES